MNYQHISINIILPVPFLILGPGEQHQRTKQLHRTGLRRTKDVISFSNATAGKHQGPDQPKRRKK